MARSLPASFKALVMRRSLLAAALFASAALGAQVLRAQTANSYILAARRGGAIEIIDPDSLVTIGRIHFDLPAKSAGLNGISASADGTKLYVEGPSPKAPNGCCVLYSIDLATLLTGQVADIPGTVSRAGFVTAEGVTYQIPTPRDRATGTAPGAVDLYDPVLGKFVRMAQSGVEQGWWRNGIWMDDHFLFYAASNDGSAARLWSVSPDATDLGEGVSVEPFAKVPGCSSPVETGLAGAAGTLFIYEMFGWKLDRRAYCSGVPGGAWIIDPASGSLLAHVATDSYFHELVADREKGELYGISVGDPGWRRVELVRMDAQDGTVLQSRALESDFWRIAFAKLRGAPAADVRALLHVKK